MYPGLTSYFSDLVWYQLILLEKPLIKIGIETIVHVSPESSFELDLTFDSNVNYV